MRLIGNIEAKIDAKGRAFLPSVFRKVLQTSGEENLVLRKDVFEDCLVLYPESIWNEQTDLLRSRLNRYNAQHQRLWRQFVSEVELLTLDGNGRFLLPKRYLQMASIQQSIRFIGNGGGKVVEGRIRRSLAECYGEFGIVAEMHCGQLKRLKGLRSVREKRV